MEKLTQELLNDLIEKRVFASFAEIKGDFANASHEDVRAAIHAFKSNQTIAAYKAHLKASKFKEMVLKAMKNATDKLNENFSHLLDKMITS